MLLDIRNLTKTYRAPDGGDAVDVHASELGSGVGLQDYGGLLADFTPGCVPDLGIVGFDVAAWQEPSVQSSMVDQEDSVAIGGEDKAGAGDVSGGVLGAGERVGGGVEEKGDEFLTLEGLAIGGVVEGLGDGFDGGRMEHKSERPNPKIGPFDLNRATSYSPT